MIIALDYDHTFTEDPAAWCAAMHALRLCGHEIVGVTMRYDHETHGMDPRYADACDRIFFTGRKAKQPFMAERGIIVNVWIDDNPHWILGDAR